MADTECEYCKDNECQKFVKECYEPWVIPDTALFCNGTLSEMQTCGYLSEIQKKEKGVCYD